MTQILSSQYPKPVQVHIDAEKLLCKHGLKDDGWQFELSNRKGQLGTCFYGKKLIVYSHHFLNQPDRLITDTILHEIAHALVGPGHGHDDVWKAKCIEIGANPNRLVESVVSLPAHNFIVQCPKCNKTWRRYRVKKSLRTATHCGVRVVVYRVKHNEG